MRVLISDDNVELRGTLAQLVADSGFDVEQADDSQAALDLVSDGLYPDLMLLDV